jgi:hypothetical protein
VNEQDSAPVQTDRELLVQAVPDASLSEEPCCSHRKKRKKQDKRSQKEALAEAYQKELLAITIQNIETLALFAAQATEKCPSAIGPLQSILEAYSSSAACTAKI